MMFDYRGWELLKPKIFLNILQLFIFLASFIFVMEEQRIKNKDTVLSLIINLYFIIFVLLVSLYFFYKTRGLYDQGDYNLSKQGDFNLRYNEICAAHERINSFLIWDGQIISDKYIGFERPDKILQKDANQCKMVVHAYPPWHITFFFFYGWIPRGIMNIIFLLTNCIIVIILFFYLLYYCLLNRYNIYCFIIIIWGMSLYFQAHIKLCLSVGNYCIIIAGLSVVFYWLLEHKKQSLAGVIWALMMIKPQVSMLFFWPLFFAKQWKTICVAVITCIIATFFPAYLFKQSPIELILEIPKIGAPYCFYAEYSGPLLSIVNKLFGSNSIIIATIIGFCLCGVLCFFSKHYNKWWQKCLPVMLVIPYWTYAQRMDWLIGWNVILAILLVIIHRSPFINLQDSKITRFFFIIEFGISLLFSLVLLMPRSKPHQVHSIIDFIIHLSIAIVIIINGYKSRNNIVVQ